MELQTAKGVRDFPPEEKILRQQVVDILRTIFENYGFSPLETPILERFETLSAKYAGGAEILKETFKFKDQGDRDIGLRYDLTVPLARFVGMNPNLKLPFKRYEIGRVFRDGPIKLGRYREFWQCDIDIIGSKSMVAEAELLTIVDEVFKKLKIDIDLKINNRKLLDGIMIFAGIKENSNSAILSLDKIEKIGQDGVEKELKEKGFSKDQIKGLFEAISKKKLSDFEKLLKDNEGIKELKELFLLLDELKISYKFDPCLARGLAYYTGTVFEVFAKKEAINSALAAGGRYDKMIGAFLEGNKDYPAVGIAFGLEPITEILKTRVKDVKKTVTKYFIIPIKTLKESLIVAKKLRDKEINTDIDLMDRGISKNLDYANSLGIPFVIIIGPEELKQKKVKVRDMKSGKETFISV